MQARRTGTSSPLGELFDHGCDAWATVFICGTFYSVFGRDLDGYSISELRMYGILWSIFLSFHLSHWEKYLTGVMYLPWSYDFSMLGGTIIYLVTSVAGYQVGEIKVDPCGKTACARHRSFYPIRIALHHRSKVFYTYCVLRVQSVILS